MKTISLPSQERLRELLDYDPETGILTWKQRERRFKHAGQEAFTALSDRGYKRGKIGDVQYRAHRIIYKWVHNEEPPEIDHLNGIRTDNRIANLAASNRRSNMWNMAVHRDNPGKQQGIFKSKNGWYFKLSIGSKPVWGVVRQTQAEAVADRDNLLSSLA